MAKSCVFMGTCPKPRKGAIGLRPGKKKQRRRKYSPKEYETQPTITAIGSKTRRFRGGSGL